GAKMSIALGKVFEPFVEQRPICVMARGVLEHLFNAERIDALFARTAEVQYTRALLFSSVVDLMGQVVLGVQPSVLAAYQAKVDLRSNVRCWDKCCTWSPKMTFGWQIATFVPWIFCVVLQRVVAAL